MFLLQKKTFLVSILVLAVSLIPAAPESFSQEMTKGELSGVVTDASGARVPAASVVATHIATQFTREAQSNDSGVYVMSFLPIGEYTLSAESSGFRKYSQSGINLGGGDKKVIDIVLEVGEVTDVIEVTAAAPLVDRSDATLGVNLEASTVATLPVNGRDFSAVLILQPGAVQGGTGAFSSGNNLQRGGVHEPGERASISFNGAQDSWSSNNYTMDGIDVSEIHFGLLLANSISMESISEVVVDTTNYTAENGRSASGKINFISKSGGNDIHGSAFEFYRGTKLVANEYFLEAAGEPKPDFSHHQYGGSLGGPVIKDKLFYFGSYEGIRLDKTSTLNITALSAPFKATLDPELRAYFDYMPLPTRPSADDPRVGDLTLAGPLANRNDVFLIRFDANVSDTHQLFGRVNRSRQSLSNGARLGGYPDWPNLNETAMDNWSVTWNASPTPTAFNEFSWGLQDRYEGFVQFDGFQDLAPKCPACGVLTVSGVIQGSTVPGQFSAPQESRAYYLSDVFRKLVGNHSLSMGGEWRTHSSSQGRLNSPGYTFQTLDDLAANSPLSASNTWGFEPFAMGPALQSDWGFFFQDDWKVTPRLTLNLGVRYDFVTPNVDNRSEPPGRRPIWDEAVQLGILNCKICTPFNYLTPGTQVEDPINDKFFTRAGDHFRNGDYNNLAPRFGMALDVFGDGKTVLRGGYGIVYQVLEPATFGGQRSAINALPRLSISRNDKPDLRFPTLDFAAAGGLVRLTFIDPDIEQGWTRQWNVSLQRELGGGNMVQATYTGNRTRVLSIFNPRYQMNPFIPDPVDPTGGNYLDPCCGSIGMRSAPIHTDYHALQMTFRRQVTSGLAVTAFYTWAHVIAEYNDRQLGGFFFRKPDLIFPDGPGSNFLRFERSAGFNDVRHNFITNILYELPFGQHPVVRGWQLSSIIDARTGVPFNTPNSGFLNRYRARSRVDILPGVPIYTGYVGPDKPYLNRAAFGVPPQDAEFPVDSSGNKQVQLGKSESRQIYGPGRWNVDLGVIKDNRIGENHNIQFRAEIFNLFNHMNWGAPNGLRLNFTAPNFGRIFRPAISNRQVQLGVRWVF
jgi:outer membrane receptor protein involved in Fe transport